MSHSSSKPGSTLSRRELLQASLALGGTAAIGGGLLGSARASALDPDRHFLFIFAYGGQDVMSTIDPRPMDVYTPERRRSTLTIPTYDQKGVSSKGVAYGQWLGELESRIDDLCIVRGMSMDVPDHHGASRRFITGRPPVGQNAKGSSIATHLAAELGALNPIPNLSIGVETFNVDRAAWASGMKVASLDTLRVVLGAGRATLPAAAEEEIDILMSEFGACNDACASDRRASAFAGRDAGRAILKQNRKADFDFTSTGSIRTAVAPDGSTLQSRPRADLRGFYGAGRFARDTFDTYNVTAAAAVQALCTRLTRCASVYLSDFLDDHYATYGTDVDSHGSKLARLYTRVKRIMDDLESRPYDDGSNWLDHTTILVYSEFSRGPMEGSYGGRDHWLMNGCVLAGADVKPGVVGASSEVGMNPQGCNFLTGEPDPTGPVPYPENILRGMLYSAGIERDIADLREPPLRAAFKSLSA